MTNLHKSLVAAREADQIKTRFLGNVSHDLRTPLNAIQANTELLLHDMAPGSRQARQLQDIRDASTTLNRLVTDLLDVARIEAGRLVIAPDWFGLPELMGRVVRFNTPAAEDRGIRILLSLDAALPVRVRGDAVRLEQVLNNLVSNAVRYSGGSKVCIGVRSSVVAAEAGLVFEVQDDGVGMEPETVARIFQRFEQAGAAARQRSGAGLGLSIASELVGLMGGRIEVDSRPGAGSRFRVALPLEADPALVSDPFSAADRPRLVMICAGEEDRARWESRFDGRTLPRAEVWPLQAAARRLAGVGREEGLCVVVDGGIGAGALALPGRLSVGRVAGADVAWVLVAAPEGGGDGAYRVRTPDSGVEALRRALALAVGSMPLGRGGETRRQAPATDWLCGLTLLVADDNELNRRVLGDLLTHVGGRVVEACDGAQALERLADGGIDIGLLDVRMPDLTGMEVMRAYAERQPGQRVPLIVLTADTTDECRAGCLAAGAARVLHKPVNMDSLYRALRDVIGDADRPEAGPGGELLDYGVLNELRNVGRRGDYIPSLVRCFKEDGASLIDAVREAGSRYDLAASRLLLHRMKGMSGSIGARALAACCQELLAMPDEHLRRRAPHIAGLLGRLHRDTAALLERFTRVSSSLAAP